MVIANIHLRDIWIVMSTAESMCSICHQYYKYYAVSQEKIVGRVIEESNLPINPTVSDSLVNCMRIEWLQYFFMIIFIHCAIYETPFSNEKQQDNTTHWYPAMCWIICVGWPMKIGAVDSNPWSLDVVKAQSRAIKFRSLRVYIQQN